MAASPQAKTIQVDPDLQIPQISIQIGHAQFGSYVILLWNKQGRAFLIGSGDTDDDAPTNGADASFRIVRTRAQLAQLDGFEITVAVHIQNYRTGPGEQWSCNWDVQQGDVELDADGENGVANQQSATIKKRYRIQLKVRE